MTNDFDVLQFLCDRFLDLLNHTGIAKRIHHGSLVFRFKITDDKFVYSERQVEIGNKINPAT